MAWMVPGPLSGVVLRPFIHPVVDHCVAVWQSPRLLQTRKPISRHVRRTQNSKRSPRAA